MIITIKKKHLFIICNLLYLTFFIGQVFGQDNFTFPFVVNLIIFIVPGLGWIGLLKDKIADNVSLGFFTVFLSTVVWAVLVAGHVLFDVIPQPFSFMFYMLVLTNVGLILTRPVFTLNFYNKGKFKSGAMVVSLFLVYFCMLTGMKSIPAFRDLDGEHQGTAYGLMRTGKPYLTSDIVPSPFYFAHPPLTNFYNACSVFLYDALDDYKYFFESAKDAETVLNLALGEAVTIEMQGETYRITNLDGNFFQKENMSRSGRAVESVSRKKLVRTIYDQDKFRFMENPRVFPARVSNLFASIFTFFILFALIKALTHSFFLGILGGFLYVCAPGIFVRASVSEHLAFTNCIMLLLCYQFFLPERFQPPQRGSGYLSLVPGLMAAFINQKVVIILLPIFLLNVRSFYINKKDSWREHFFPEFSIVIGYFLGLVLFWSYGLFIDHRAFFLSHVRAHLFDRIMHHNSMFIEDYPTLFRLWYEFQVEFPALILSVLAVWGLAKFSVNRCERLCLLWFLCGAFLFSLVDWKQTNHFMFMAPALIVMLMGYITRQGIFYKKVLVSGVFISLAYSLWMNMRLMNNFTFYLPTSGW